MVDDYPRGRTTTISDMFNPLLQCSFNCVQVVSTFRQVLHAANMKYHMRTIRLEQWE